MPELIKVVNKWRNSKREIKIVSAQLNSPEALVIKHTRACEPYLRSDETFEVESRTPISEAEYTKLSRQFGVLTLPAQVGKKKRALVGA